MPTSVEFGQLPKWGAVVNIYVGNLSFDVSEEQLRQEFVAFGDVLSVIIMSDKYIGSGQTRGYGYVQMVSKAEGESAIAALQGKMLGSRAIDVVAALPLSDRKIESLNGKTNKQYSRKVRQRR